MTIRLIVTSTLNPIFTDTNTSHYDENMSHLNTSKIVLLNPAYIDKLLMVSKKNEKNEKLAVIHPTYTFTQDVNKIYINDYMFFGAL